MDDDTREQLATLREKAAQNEREHAAFATRETLAALTTRVDAMQRLLTGVALSIVAFVGKHAFALIEGSLSGPGP